MNYRHCNGQHDLLDIASRPAGGPGMAEVVRWCRNCGGIVVDVDVDGRTQPGGAMSMQFARIAQAYASQTRVEQVPLTPEMRQQLTVTGDVHIPGAPSKPT